MDLDRATEAGARQLSDSPDEPHAEAPASGAPSDGSNSPASPASPARASESDDTAPGGEARPARKRRRRRKSKKTTGARNTKDGGAAVGGDGSAARAAGDDAGPERDARRDRETARSATPALRERGETIYRELAAMAEEILDKHGVPHSRVDRLPIAIETELGVFESRGVDGREFVDRLIASFHRAAEEHVAESTPFPLGRVHCFWCGENDCKHASPPDPRSVFSGFSQYGEPIWSEFASLALDLQHPDVQSLFDDRGLPITLVQTGSYLARDQLGVHGKHSQTFRLLGQVNLGYLPIAGSRRPTVRDPIALSFQAVETCRTRRQYHLNVVGVLPDGRPIGTFLEESVDPRLCDAVAVARRKLAELALAHGYDSRTSGGQRRRRRRFVDRERVVLRVMQRFARNLDRIYRQRSRRTQHAQERHQDRERPASSAVRDALLANLESVYRDEHEGTWIVIGPRNRVHVFNAAARHVTSVVYPRETIRARLKQRKWVRGEESAVEGFLDRLESLVGG